MRKREAVQASCRRCESIISGVRGGAAAASAAPTRAHASPGLLRKCRTCAHGRESPVRAAKLSPVMNVIVCVLTSGARIGYSRYVIQYERVGCGGSFTGSHPD
ncbi:unnamed protein product [Pleuronectes platessa]|uniref:Uncharacterized protein n=1 Tax=Pleuronectes platessa TaxID=8262 RepID=A0A9N7VDJ7_PLEPL|nr:unnamed protein product [Pleuronectes platessa]